MTVFNLDRAKAIEWLSNTSGYDVLAPEFFRRLPEKGDHETATFPGLAAEGRLFGFKSRAYWRPVDSIKDLTEAERELQQLARAGA